MQSIRHSLRQHHGLSPLCVAASCPAQNHLNSRRMKNTHSCSRGDLGRPTGHNAAYMDWTPHDKAWRRQRSSRLIATLSYARTRHQPCNLSNSIPRAEGLQPRWRPCIMAARPSPGDPNGHSAADSETEIEMEVISLCLTAVDPEAKQLPLASPPMPPVPSVLSATASGLFFLIIFLSRQVNLTGVFYRAFSS